MKSDKGYLVVMPDSMYSERALNVMDKCFKEVTIRPQEAKKHALEFLEKCNLDNLASQVKKKRTNTAGVLCGEDAKTRGSVQSYRFETGLLAVYALVLPSKDARDVERE